MKSLPVSGARLFTFILAGKVSQSLWQDLLHSRLQEKSPGPWSEIIYIPPRRKNLPVPGAGPFTFTGTGNVSRSLERDLLHSPGHENSPGPWSETFYIALCTKVSRSQERDFLHSPMQEKSPSPWSETFYIHPCRKSFPVSRERELFFICISSNTVTSNNNVQYYTIEDLRKQVHREDFKTWINSMLYYQDLLLYFSYASGVRKFKCTPLGRVPRKVKRKISRRHTTY
jgi:hypothetical protein